MGAALAVTELFVVTLRAGFEGLSLSEDSQSILQVQHGGLVGLICDDGFDTAVAQVACRDLGMAGGVALSVNAHTGTILADNVQCTGGEVSLRDCRFSGWHLHDCTPQEAAGTDFWVGGSFVAALFTVPSFFSASCVVRGDTQARQTADKQASKQASKQAGKHARNKQEHCRSTRLWRPRAWCLPPPPLIIKPPQHDHDEYILIMRRVGIACDHIRHSEG